MYTFTKTSLDCGDSLMIVGFSISDSDICTIRRRDRRENQRVIRHGRRRRIQMHRCEKWHTEDRIETITFLQQLPRRQKCRLDTLEYLGIVHGSRGICKLEWLLNAQYFPLMRIILRRPHLATLFNGQTGSCTNGNGILCVTEKKKI